MEFKVLLLGYDHRQYNKFPIHRRTAGLALRFFIDEWSESRGRACTDMTERMRKKRFIPRGLPRKAAAGDGTVVFLPPPGARWLERESKFGKDGMCLLFMKLLGDAKMGGVDTPGRSELVRDPKGLTRDGFGIAE